MHLLYRDTCLQQFGKFLRRDNFEVFSRMFYIMMRVILVLRLISMFSSEQAHSYLPLFNRLLKKYH